MSITSYIMSTDNRFESKKRKKPATTRSLEFLSPKTRKMAVEFLQECEKSNLKVIITCTYRSQEEQNRLWQQGRDSNGKKIGPTVTNVKGGKSRHNDEDKQGNPASTAFDICPLTDSGKEDWNSKYWNTFGIIGRRIGLEWGGDWISFVDKPHFQLNDKDREEELKTCVN